MSSPCTYFRPSTISGSRKVSTVTTDSVFVHELPASEKRPVIDATAKNERKPAKFAEVVATITKLNRARRVSVTINSKEKSVMVILAVITLMVTVCNIPSAVVRIINNEKYDKDLTFQVPIQVLIVNYFADFLIMKK